MIKLRFKTFEERHKTYDLEPDVTRIVQAFANLGYEISRDTAERAWTSHSDEWCASWLILDGKTDREIVECIAEYLTPED